MKSHRPLRSLPWTSGQASDLIKQFRISEFDCLIALVVAVQQLDRCTDKGAIIVASKYRFS
jgi:hypothetical protein